MLVGYKFLDFEELAKSAPPASQRSTKNYDYPTYERRKNGTKSRSAAKGYSEMVGGTRARFPALTYIRAVIAIALLVESSFDIRGRVNSIPSHKCRK